MSAGFIGKKPEASGVNQLVSGSAAPAFLYWLDTWSDIQEHLMRLFQASKGNVIELGTRGGISTSALLAGVEQKGGHITSIDIDEKCSKNFSGHQQWSFFCASSLDNEMPARALANAGLGAIDLLFIDTEHTHKQLKAELELWAGFMKKPGGVIMMHDVVTFPDMGRAAVDFAASRSCPYIWFPGSNGLGIINL